MSAPTPAAAAPPRRTSSATGEWDAPEPTPSYGVAPDATAPPLSRRTASASGAWEAPEPTPSYGVRPDATAPARASVPFGASGLWEMASAVTRPDVSPEYARARGRAARADELPPVPRTDDTLPLWQQVYDEMKAELDRTRPAEVKVNDFPDSVRERAMMARVEREVRRRYWAGR